jgi:hypothetical protein
VPVESLLAARVVPADAAAVVVRALRDCLAVQPDAGYEGLRALAKEVRKAEVAEAKAKLDAVLAGTDPQRTPRGWQQVDV